MRGKAIVLSPFSYRRYAPIMILLVLAVSGRAQQIGTCISGDGALPNANAMLDVQSSATGDGKGLLIPRITENQRTNAGSALAGGLLDDSGNLRGGAAQGLMVYQTDGAQGFYYNTSASTIPAWLRVGTGDGDFMADGSVPMSGALQMNGQAITNADSMAFSDGFVAIGNGAQSYSTLSGSVAIGDQATARYRQSGVAVGVEADGDYNGIAIGYQADGQYSNVAVGFQASAYSGYDRIAIGRSITNRVNNSAAIRGTLYLDGGTGVMVRSSVGSGGWSLKAFAIPHPLDPENMILRHFCLEGPEVWNVYAGNAELVHGQAVIELPAYHAALNKAGSEIVSLTPWGKAVVWVGSVMDNRLTIHGDADVKVSWTIKALRNDPACLEDLKRRPVEQVREAGASIPMEDENRGLQTGLMP